MYKMRINKRLLNINSWSAPVLMSVLMIIFMIMIFTIEQAGLSRRSANVELRMTSLEKISIVHSSENKSIKIAELVSEIDMTEQFSKERESHIENMNRILVDGLQYQMSLVEQNDHMLENESIVLFDI